MCLLLGSHPEVLNHSLLILLSVLAWLGLGPLIGALPKGLLAAPGSISAPCHFCPQQGGERNTEFRNRKERRSRELVGETHGWPGKGVS